MNLKFWGRKTTLETRQDSLTDELVNQILARNGESTTGRPGASGALQAAAGLVGRAFGSCTIEGARPSVQQALTPVVMEQVGRALMTDGEALFVIRISASQGLQLFRVTDYDVTGTYDPASWVYRCDLSGPSGISSMRVRPESLLHFRYLVSKREPWKGLAPLQVATEAAALSANVNDALKKECAGPVGSVIATPKDGSDDGLTGLRSDLQGLNGRLALVETTANAYGAGPAQAPRTDWKPQRLGANPPDSLISLRNDSDRLLLAALGVPVGLLEKVDGASLRESWRQLLHSTLSPLGKMIEIELREKLDSPSLSLGWQALMASDISGRARAFGSLVNGGMEIDRALAVTGLLAQEEG